MLSIVRRFCTALPLPPIVTAHTTKTPSSLPPFHLLIKSEMSTSILAGLNSEVHDYYKKIPKVELHVHLDGSLRVSTLRDLSKHHGIDLPHHDEDLFQEHVTINGPQNSLTEFLKPFKKVSTIISSSPDAIERCMYEFCEDSAAQGVVYSEPRFSPQLASLQKRFSPEEAVQAAIRGLKRGQVDFSIKARIILCMVKGSPIEWAQEVIRLAILYKDQGVVGVDIAGDELQPFDPYIPHFKEAQKNGLHITAHAGESGPAANVKLAIEVLGATRIGHGYHCVEDPQVVRLIKEKNIHLEACPLSSVGTNSGAVGLNSLQRYAEEDLSFSINSDDPGIMRSELVRDYQAAVERFGLPRALLPRTVLGAAAASFLPEDEKKALIADLQLRMDAFVEEFAA